jgi:hypothetical protein
MRISMRGRASYWVMAERPGFNMQGNGSEQVKARILMGYRVEVEGISGGKEMIVARASLGQR